MIETATVVCIALAMLVPQSLRVAGLTPFDVAIYGTITAYYARAFFRPRAATRIDPLHLSLFALLLSNIAAYFLTVDDFCAQESFIYFTTEQDWTKTNVTALFVRVAIWGLARLILIFAALDLGRTMGRSRRYTHAAITVFLAAGSLNALISLYGWYRETHGALARYNFLPLIEGGQGSHMDRMLLTFAIALGIWLRGLRSEATTRFRMLAVMFLTLASITTVFVRQGWVLLIVITFLVVVMTWGSIPLRLRLRALLLAVLLVGAGAAFVISRADQLRDLFVNVSEPGARDIVIRTTLIRRAFQVFLEHPWVGVGYGEYFAYSTVPAAVTNIDVYVGSAHNGAMMVLAEMGVVGTVCFAIMAFSILRRARQACLRSADDFTRGATTAVLAFLVVSFLVHFIGNSAFLPIPQERVAAENAFLLWLLIGVSAGIAEVNEVRRAKPAKRKFWLARSLAGRRRIATITTAGARAPL